MRRIALAALIAFLATGCGRGYSDAHGAWIVHVTLHSRLLGRDLGETLVRPRGRGRGRSLLVLLHGRSSKPDSWLSDELLGALSRLGARAPNLLLANGGDHSYFHDRRDGRWGSSVLEEAIPDAIRRTHADPRRLAIGGISMGGFGALDLARLAPGRFCAVGGHSAALWLAAGDTAPGAFDDAEDSARHDVVRLARYRVPVWIDVGADDPFRAADAVLARRVHATFHVWPGAHETEYWRRHVAQYLAWYAAALADC